MTNKEKVIEILNLYVEKAALIQRTIEAIESDRFLPSYVSSCLLKAGHAQATTFEHDLYRAGLLMLDPDEK